jgi:hypothetical protein
MTAKLPTISVLLLALQAFLAAGAAPAGAQVVEGQLRAASTNRPLAGARLHLIDEHDGAVDSTRTDVTGRFRLAAPAAGTYLLYFQLDGWASVPSDPIRLTADATSDFDFIVPLVSNAAIRQIGEIFAMDARLQTALPELCGEPFRAWEAGLLLGRVRPRAGGEPIAGARVMVIAPAGAGADAGRATLSSESGVYILCNVPPGTAVGIRVVSPDGVVDDTDVEIHAGTASWYDLLVGPGRR